jgi:hypothetical protein
MGKWLLKMGLAAACCAAASAAPAAAAPAATEVYASLEALYWKAGHSPILVARRFIGGSLDGGPVTAEDLVHQEETFSTGDSDFGGRLRVGYSSCECNWFVEGSYLSWEATESIDLKEAPYTNTFVYGFAPKFAGDAARQLIDSVRSTIKFRYQNASLRAGREVFSGCNYSLRGCAGFSWASIDFENNGFVDINELGLLGKGLNHYRQYADFSGFGLGLGFAGDYRFCGGWSAVGAFGIDLLYGSSDITEDFSVTGNPPFPKARLLSEGQSWTHFVPSCNFRLGAKYSSSCFSLDLGWEVHCYANVMRFTSDNVVPATPASGQIMSVEAQGLTFGGPYVGIGARF